MCITQIFITKALHFVTDVRKTVLMTIIVKVMAHIVLAYHY